MIKYFWIILLTGCASMHTQQNLQNSSDLSPGMSKSKVKNIMGQPAKTEFQDGKMAWHYCKTGYSSDEFIVVVFENKKLIKMKSYGVTLEDTGGATGDCAKFIRPYEFDKPDSTKEIRIKEIQNH